MCGYTLAGNISFSLSCVHYVGVRACACACADFNLHFVFEKYGHVKITDQNSESERGKERGRVYEQAKQERKWTNQTVFSIHNTFIYVNCIFHGHLRKFKHFQLHGISFVFCLFVYTDEHEPKRNEWQTTVFQTAPLEWSEWSKCQSPPSSSIV